MILIFCTSHLYIPATLSIIQQNDNVCIYTDRESISIFIKKMYPEIDTFLLRNYTNKGFFYSNFCGICEKKRNMLDFVRGKKIDAIMFFHEGFCNEANWLIKHLNKAYNSKVFYMPIERTFVSDINWEETRDIKFFIKKIYNYLIWGYRIHYYKYLNNVYPITDQTFYSAVHCKEISASIKSVNIISDINKRLLNPAIYPENGIIWLENTTRIFKVKWNENSYLSFLEQVYPNLPRGRVFFKGHPDKALKYGKEANFEEIPSFIPGNLLINRFVCYVGVVSDLMFEAANAGTLTISTIYLFDINDKDREILADYLRNRSKDIKFPKNKTEFLELISSI